MKAGDVIWVRAFKADGSTHRWFRVLVEDVQPDCIITWTQAGNPVYLNRDRFERDAGMQSHPIRAYYWPGRRHNLLEVYETDGRLRELYADIISPLEVTEGEIRFIDHELDVSQLAGEDPRIVDEDEFEEAAAKYGYSEEFVRQCHELAKQLLVVVGNWRPQGIRTTRPEVSPDSQN